MKLLTLSALLLMFSTTVTVNAEDLTIPVERASIERLDASEPATYDLGDNKAIIFYYTDSNGDRLLVAVIGPKDPDSGVLATQQIIKMGSVDQYVINIGGSEPVKLSAHFEGNELVVTFDQV